ncbi:MAG: hypothetical protein H0W01_11530 [Pseudonocardiales bacterium]|nr:hypothetical protein [Pseudonocardiales bacterium]
MTALGRYEGKPLLRLIDSYAYWAIGELSDQQERLLEEMTPRLRELYGSSGTWQEIVAKQMEYPDTFPERLRELWEQNQRIAAERNETLPVDVFVTQVVDNSLVS